MKPRTPGFWLIAVLLGLLALLPMQALAGMSPAEVLKFQNCMAKAKQGDAIYQYNAGVYYNNGDGVPRDLVQSLYWYRKAAEQGYLNAQYRLGEKYNVGVIVAKDDLEALKWFSKAANQGHTQAQYNVGHFYEKGYGVTRDMKMALYWYRSAGAQGYAMAQFNVGHCYANGLGVAKDHMQAVSWYRRAAMQGDAIAQRILADYYAKGEGHVAKNELDAYVFYSLAGTLDVEASNKAAVLEKKLSRSDVAAGQRRVKELQKYIAPQ